MASSPTQSDSVAPVAVNSNVDSGSSSASEGMRSPAVSATPSVKPAARFRARGAPPPQSQSSPSTGGTRTEKARVHARGDIGDRKTESSVRRRHVVARRGKNPPSATPVTTKRFLSASTKASVAPLASPYFPFQYPAVKTEALNCTPTYPMEDVDMLLYSAKELLALVEAERFGDGSRAFLSQLHVLVIRMSVIAHNVTHASCVRTSPVNASVPPTPLTKAALYDNLIRACNSMPGLTTMESVMTSSSGKSPNPAVEAVPLPEVSPNRVLKRAKVTVPEHPNYNFIGRILGPRGISVRQLEAATGCGVLIRGKGSVKNEEREERLRDKNTPGFEHLHEPLHVLITAEGSDEAECDSKLEACQRRIESLLKPEYDEYKRRQLAQLAMINGNYDASRGIGPPGSL